MFDLVKDVGIASGNLYTHILLYRPLRLVLTTTLTTVEEAQGWSLCRYRGHGVRGIQIGNSLDFTKLLYRKAQLGFSET